MMFFPMVSFPEALRVGFFEAQLFPGPASLASQRPPSPPSRPAHIPRESARPSVTSLGRSRHRGGRVLVKIRDARRRRLHRLARRPLLADVGRAEPQNRGSGGGMPQCRCCGAAEALGARGRPREHVARSRASDSVPHGKRPRGASATLSGAPRLHYQVDEAPRPALCRRRSRSRQPPNTHIPRVQARPGCRC